MRIRTISIAAAVLAATLCVVALPGVASATPNRHITQGAAWLRGQVTDGYVPYDGAPDLSDTVQTATALAAAVADGAKGAGMLATLEAYIGRKINVYVDGKHVSPSAANDDAGALARLMLLDEATHTGDLSALATRLVATQQLSGLFGASDPSYDGTLRQGLAMIALHGDGMTWSDPVMTSARTWLLAQQCTDGGFSADASSDLTGCTDDPADYLGPDTNSTAIAIWALSPSDGAPGVLPAVTSALGFLAGLERGHATWGWMPGNGADSNSSAMVDIALYEDGQAPASTTGPWAVGGMSPLAGLERFQVTTGPAGSGGFRYQLSSSSPTPDVLSSEQGLLALSMLAR
jgi:hypothetical protein